MATGEIDTSLFGCQEKDGFRQKAVRKQANLMEHELLKMPDLDAQSTKGSILQESRLCDRKPGWDHTFWNLESQKKRIDKDLMPCHRRLETCADMSNSLDGLEEKAEQKCGRDPPKRQISLSRHRSWRCTIRQKIHERLLELRQEEMEERKNNDTEAINEPSKHVRSGMSLFPRSL